MAKPSQSHSSMPLFPRPTKIQRKAFYLMSISFVNYWLSTSNVSSASDVYRDQIFFITISFLDSPWIQHRYTLLILFFISFHLSFLFLFGHGVVQTQVTDRHGIVSLIIRFLFRCVS